MLYLSALAFFLSSSAESVTVADPNLASLAFFLASSSADKVFTVPNLMDNGNGSMT